MPWEHWSARWTAQLCFENPRAFYIQYDDALRLYIDGSIIHDAWNGPPNELWKPYGLSGCHTMTVEYRQFTGGASVKFGTYQP